MENNISGCGRWEIPKLVWSERMPLRCFDGEMQFTLRWKILYRYGCLSTPLQVGYLVEKKT